MSARAVLRVPAGTPVREFAAEQLGEAVGSVEVGVHGELAVYGPSAGLRALACALLRAADTRPTSRCLTGVSRLGGRRRDGDR